MAYASRRSIAAHVGYPRVARASALASRHLLVLDFFEKWLRTTLRFSIVRKDSTINSFWPKDTRIIDLPLTAINQKTSPVRISGEHDAIKFDRMKTKVDEGSGGVTSELGNDVGLVGF